MSHRTTIHDRTQTLVQEMTERMTTLVQHLIPIRVLMYTIACPSYLHREGSHRMARITHIAPHLSPQEVQQKMENARSAWLRKRWLVIYTALLDPRTSGEIAKQLGVSRPFVKKVVSLYKRFGPPGMETPGSGGRHNAYLSHDAEVAFLAPFNEQAARGDIVTTKTIQSAFEVLVGEEVDDSTIYRLLERHHWRKVVPRAIHPQAEPLQQEEFKKTSVHLLKKQLQPKNQKTHDQIS